MKFLLLSAMFSFIALCTVGCTTTKVPIDTVSYGKMDASEHDKLIVFLRGRGGNHESFEKAGFVKEIRDRKLPYDMIAPNAHLGYYRNRNLVLRLREDIILPAKAKGYKEIWFVGVSLGGIGASFYTQQYPEDITGVIYISPFLGWERIAEEIEEAGGINQWRAVDPSDENWEHLLWDWLQKYHRDPNRTPPIYLAYGKDDFFGKNMVLLDNALPEEKAIAIDGGHDIPTFYKLWKMMLDKGVLN